MADRTSHPPLSAPLRRRRVSDVLGSPSAPWPGFGVLLIGFLLTEAFVHTTFFGAVSFTDALLFPERHELWMRLVVAGALAVASGLWSFSVQERQRRLDMMALMEAQLRDFNVRLASGEAHDRRVLSVRLHEDVGQMIAAAGMHLAAVERDPLSPADRASLEQAAMAIGRAMSECREIAHELQPPLLEDYGLGMAIESLAAKVMRRTGRSVEVHTQCDAAEVDPEARAAAYQVLCEVVEAVAHDPATSTVRLLATCAGDHARITVRWDGREHEGKVASAEWLQRAGGRITRHSTVDGARLDLVLPLLKSA